MTSANCCMHCSERHAGCHSQCEKYTAWKREHQERKARELEVEIAENDRIDYCRKNRDRMLRNAGKKC